uniref:Immunoglobulin domain-containing protein n=1 Tax=Pygocentrus nattereri TaxID=42514 RepID=A0AAR2KPA9_PYGNA
MNITETRMKILLIFTLHLISGGAAGTDVIGFLGGRVTINFKHNVYDPEVRQVFFCKAAKCEIIIYDQRNRWILKDRFHLYGDFHQALTVTFKQLSSEDAGPYQYGENKQLKHQFNLQVIRDPCCLGPNTMTGYVGETITISFSYPEQFESHTKLFYKRDGLRFNIMIGTTETQRGRFYMSDNRESKVFSVRISNVTEDDGGVYYCGVWNEGESVSYQSLYTEIQLQVTEKSTTETSGPATHHSGHYLITIPVCVCVVLLLIGGSALIFYKHRSVSTNTQIRTPNRADADYENDPSRNQNNISMGPIYQSLDPKISQSDSVYQSLNPNISQSESAYQSLNTYTNQSDSAYQSLNPNTNQSDSAYQSLNPNTNQADSAYQSLNPNTNQADSAYQNLNIKTK